MKNIYQKMQKLMISVSLSMMILITYGMPVQASGIAENAANYFSSELFWVGVIVVFIGLIICLVKRNIVGAISTLIFGVLILFIIANPAILKSLGNSIGSKIFGE